MDKRQLLKHIHLTKEMSKPFPLMDIFWVFFNIMQFTETQKTAATQSYLERRRTKSSVIGRGSCEVVASHFTATLTRPSRGLAILPSL